MSRSLLLKGLGGVGVIAGAGSLVVFREKIFGVGEEDLSEFKHKELIEKVGLECQLSEDDIGEETKVCTVKSGGTINVEVGGQKEEGVKFSSSTSKLKVSKDEKYSGKLKFVVDSGDLELTKGESTPTLFTKLEQFETYEVKKVKEKFYLKRKTEAKEGKKEALGLGECGLPGAGDSNCSLTTEEIKKVKFEGHDTEGITVSTGTVNLKISRVEDTTTFTDGYRFTFTFPQDLTINSKTLKANTPYDFKIKKHENSNNLTLERAWTAAALGNKVGLTCTSKNECTIGSNLNVKQGDKNDTGLNKSGGSNDAKIKVKKDQEGYNQGFKFEIEGGNIDLTAGTAKAEEDKIKSLDEYETYEVKEEGNNWYLSRKEEAIVYIKKALGIEKFCTENSFSTIMTCNITDVEKLKNIKFEGKNNHRSWPSSGTIDVQLAIEKDPSLPSGLKFTFTDNGKSGTQLCIPTGSGSINLNDSSNTGGVEYKIKKSGPNNKTLSLVKKS